MRPIVRLAFAFVASVSAGCGSQARSLDVPDASTRAAPNVAAAPAASLELGRHRARAAGTRLEIGLGAKHATIGAVVRHGGVDLLAGVPFRASSQGARPSLERVAGPVVERVEALSVDLEQSWSFARRPEGEGDLEVALEVDGAEVRRVGERGVELDSFTYGHGLWRDADGVATEIPASHRDGAIRLTVPRALIASSRYPAVLDPRISPVAEVDVPVGVGNSAVWVQIAGLGSGLGMGFRLVGAAPFGDISRLARVTLPSSVLDSPGLPDPCGGVALETNGTDTVALGTTSACFVRPDGTFAAPIALPTTLTLAFGVPVVPDRLAGVGSTWVYADSACRYRRFTSAGMLPGATDLPGGAAGCGVVPSGARFLASWIAGGVVHFAALDAAGGLGTDNAVSGWPTTGTSVPVVHVMSVVYHPINGEHLAVVSDSAQNIRVRRLSATGAPLGSEGTIGSGFAPRVAVADGTRWSVIWQGSTCVARHVSSTGVAVEAAPVALPRNCNPIGRNDFSLFDVHSDATSHHVVDDGGYLTTIKKSDLSTVASFRAAYGYTPYQPSVYGPTSSGNSLVSWSTTTTTTTRSYVRVDATGSALDTVARALPTGAYAGIGGDQWAFIGATGLVWIGADGVARPVIALTPPAGFTPASYVVSDTRIYGFDAPSVGSALRFVRWGHDGALLDAAPRSLSTPIDGTLVSRATTGAGVVVGYQAGGEFVVEAIDLDGLVTPVTSGALAVTAAPSLLTAGGRLRHVLSTSPLSLVPVAPGGTWGAPVSMPENWLPFADPSGVFLVRGPVVSLGTPPSGLLVQRYTSGPVLPASDVTALTMPRVFTDRVQSATALIGERKLLFAFTSNSRIATVVIDYGRDDGAACAAPTDCESGFCVDSVCCDGACAGTCEACDVAGVAGKCSPVDGRPHGARPACTGAAPHTDCGSQCLGALDRKACTVAPATTACSRTACVASVETHLSACDGLGACADVPKDCGGYACQATSCGSTCTSKSHCASGYYCLASTCVAVEGLGRPCTASTDCAAPASCVDGACCESASCGAGETCAGSAARGRCARVLGQACALDAECGSGHCADGVCCDAACTGACAACDVAGFVGTCAPVRGAPHGARPPCASDPAHPCASGTCDGNDTTKCAGLVGAEVVCAAAACSNGGLVNASRCDGTGACAAGTTSSCGGFACASATACKDSCASDADCLSGYYCGGGKCAARTRSCTADGLSSVEAATGQARSCAPFACDPVSGDCRTRCESESDCELGLRCNSSGECVSPSVAADRGCQGSGRAPGALGLAWLGLTALVCARRRR